MHRPTLFVFLLLLGACRPADTGVAADSGPGLDAGAPVCVIGADQTCNELPQMSALAGTCTATGCVCSAGFELAPSGRCRPSSGEDAGAPDAGTLDAGAPDAGVDWRRCQADAGAGECQPPGLSCRAPRALYAYSWFVPAHWDGGQPPAGSTLIAGEPVSTHGGGNTACDWRNDNSSAGCVGCSGGAFCLWDQTRYARTFQELSTRLKARPAGHRAVFWIPSFSDVAPHNDPRDFSAGVLADGGAGPGIWWDRGAERLAEDVTVVMAGLKDAGVTVDWLFADVEWGLLNWTFGGCDEGDPADRARSTRRWTAITTDPRFQAIEVAWRDRYDAGFQDLSDLCPFRSWVNGGSRYLQWNALMEERTAAFYRTGLYDSTRAVFPQVKVSNYEYRHTSPSLPILDMHSHEVSRFGEGAVVGTHQSPQTYGMMGQISSPNFVNPALSPPTPAARYEATPFNSFRYGVNLYRASALARPDVPMAPWIGPWHVVDDPPARTSPLPMGKTPLWSELLLHVGAHAPDALIYWNNFVPACTVGDDATCDATRSGSTAAGTCSSAGCACTPGFERAPSGTCRPACSPDAGNTAACPRDDGAWKSPGDLLTSDALFEASLAEVNRVLGCDAKAPLQTALAEWWAPWVVSGVRVEGRAVWRFTPKDERAALRQVGDALEATAEGRTLVFPRAWLVSSAPGFARGQWVIQPADAPPPFERP
jgi:hypothetical protein